MIEKIDIYLSTAFFFLLFFEITLLFDRYNKRGRFHHRLKRIPWNSNTVIEVFCIWSGILVSRKLVYYIPFDGIIQTKDAVLWVSEAYVAGIILIIIMLAVTIVGVIKVSESPGAGSKISFLLKFLLVWIICIVFIVSILSKIDAGAFLENIIFINTAPLLVVKMLCSGKSLGLLIALLLASTAVMIMRYRKIRKGVKKTGKKSSIIFALIIIGIWQSGIFRVAGNWQEKFTGKAREAKSIRAFEDLFDAVGTIKKEGHRADALKEIAVALARGGHLRWSLDTAKRIGNKYTKFDALREIAAVLITKDIEIAEDILKQSIEVAGTIKNKLGKSLLLRKIAVYLAETGHIQWASSTAQKIPENKIKESALKEIRRKYDEKKKGP